VSRALPDMERVLTQIGFRPNRGSRVLLQSN
jgi:hypothetical protein